MYLSLYSRIVALDNTKENHITICYLFYLSQLIHALILASTKYVFGPFVLPFMLLCKVKKIDGDKANGSLYCPF